MRLEPLYSCIDVHLQDPIVQIHYVHAAVALSSLEMQG